jgi:chromate transporter
MSRLSDLALLFAKLGTTAFGGPAAHIALLEDEVVRRRRWLTRDEFLDYLGATNLIPGPNSTELAMHIGHRRAGRPGLIVAGLCFIMPAALIVTAIAWAYVQYGTLPGVGRVLDGVKPVVMAVVAQALWGLGRTALKRAGLVVIGLASLAAIVGGVHELAVLAAAGAASGAFGRGTGRGRAGTVVGVAAAGGAGASAALSAATVTVTGASSFALWPLFVTFLKIGSVLFGSGYVLLAFLRADFVERLGWLTEQQLLDATAVGLVTPGPVFTTATFIGYLLGGGVGAAIATTGIFLPAFVFVGLSGPIVPRLRRSAVAGAVLDGVNVASLALMAAVAWQLGRSALVDAPSVILALASLLLLIRWRVNPTWLILAGSVMGLLRAEG